MSQRILRISQKPISMDQVRYFLEKKPSVVLEQEVKKSIRAAEKIIATIACKEKPVYGVNTGFGKFSEVRIKHETANELQRRLVLSHAAGVYLRQTVAWGLDAYAPARGIPLMLERVSYDTLHQRFTIGPFGRSWSHNFEYSLIQPKPDRILIKGPGGTSRAFVKLSDGSWSSFPGDFGVLEELGDGTYKLSEQYGLAKTFNSEGRLITLGEPNGNTLSLTYVGDRLIEIQHTNGQAITFEYYGNGLIHFVTDHAGRITEYVYDEDDALLLNVIATGNVTYAYSYIPPTSSPKAGAFSPIPGTRNTLTTMLAINAMPIFTAAKTYSNPAVRTSLARGRA